MKELTIQEMAENLIEYVRKHKPKEIFIDTTGIGKPFYDYVHDAIAGETKIHAVHGISRTGDMCFRKVYD